MTLKARGRGRGYVEVWMPGGALVLLPGAEEFEPAFRLAAYILKKRYPFYLLELPDGTIIRSKERGTAYYLVDSGSENGLVRLVGKRAKILMYNVWGWHYIDPRTGRRVVTVVSFNGRLRRME